MREQILFMIY